MNNLIAVAYDDPHTAKDVLGTLRELSLERAIVLDDAVLVERHLDGRIELCQTARRADPAGLGIDDEFMRQLGEDLQPGTAAVLILLANAPAAKVFPPISPYGGRLIQSVGA